MPSLTIGRLAARAGVAVDTIRYYERIGILPAAPRSASGYRVYDEATVGRVRRVKQLQALGLTLEEAAAMCRAATAGDGCYGQVANLDRSLERVEQRIAELGAVRRALRAARHRCDRNECRLLGPAR